jgi:hypothetical protein
MSNPHHIKRFMIVHNQTTTLALNKKLSGQHDFLLFRTTNNIMQFANNGPNQLQTKFNNKE